MRTSSQIAWNTITLWLARGVHAALGLVLVPFLLAVLGKEGYGLLGVVGAVVGFSTVTDLGLRTALARHLAEQVVRKDTQRYNELISTGLAIYLLLGAALASACVILASPLADLFRASDALRAEAIFLIRWYGSAMVMIAFIKPVLAGVLTSNHRFDLNNYIISCVETVRVVGILLILGLTGSGMYGWAVACLGAEVLGLVLRHRAAYRVQPGLRIRPGHVQLSALRAMMSLGGYLYISQLATTLTVRVDPIVLTTFLGPAAVALYAPGWVLVSLVRPLVNSLGPQLHPLATGYHVSGRKEQLHALLIRGTSYTLLMAVPVCVILTVFAEPIMRFWLGRSLGPDHVTAAWVLAIFTVSAMFNFAAGPQQAVLLGMNRMGFFVLIMAVGAVLNVVASVILVGFTGLGVVGVVIPTVVVSVIRRPIIAIHTARVAGMSAARYFLSSSVRPLLVLLATLALALGLRIWVVGDSLTVFLLSVAGVAVAWIPICWWVGLGPDDRASFRGLGQRIWARVSGRPVARPPAPVRAQEAEVTWPERGQSLDSGDGV